MSQSAKPLGGDDLVMRLMYELHAHLPEDQRPLSMSDLSDEQAARARRAVHAVLSEWESAKADLAAMTTTPTDDEALVERFARAMFDEWPLHAVSPALAEQSGQAVGSPLTYDKVLEMGGDHNGLLRLAKGAVRLHAALTAAQPVEGGWQPIESAPKDGTNILACEGGAVGGRRWMRCAVVFWMDEERLKRADIYHDPGWHFSDGHNDPMWYRAGIYLTHWRPLPKPPEITTLKQGSGE